MFFDYPVEVTLNVMSKEGRRVHYMYFFQNCEVREISVMKRPLKIDGVVQDKREIKRKIFKPKKGSTVICVAFMFLGKDVVYGATKWKSPSDKATYSKSSHRKTAFGRLSVRPVKMTTVQDFSLYSRSEKRILFLKAFSERGLRGERLKTKRPVVGAQHSWLF